MRRTVFSQTRFLLGKVKVLEGNSIALFQGEQANGPDRLTDHCLGFAKLDIGGGKIQPHPTDRISVAVNDGDSQMADIDVDRDHAVADVGFECSRWFVDHRAHLPTAELVSEEAPGNTVAMYRFVRFPSAITRHSFLQNVTAIAEIHSRERDKATTKRVGEAQREILPVPMR